MSVQEHWQGVYRSKAVDRVSWYQPTAATSLRRILRTQVDPTEAVIDVGGGASVLVDALLEEGFEDVSVLDLSAAALNISQTRLRKRAALARWHVGSVLDVELPEGGTSVWHDRAVFHFMATETQQHAYLKTMAHAVRPGGHAIIATFAEDGPTTCSGLPVTRYSAEQLAAVFTPAFTLVSCESEQHTTPAGETQSFTVCHLRRVAVQA
ncbi:MAG: 2-polyprenyl-3-methyl-5-hydroxy-6-metoxy-1,4-benzoquinol methylase [Myxococcota bacterium]|jgi:2-polyprenyl-3-methyl-5-hydroxy-6-metoxy-1,4-benzoquinol methylase